MRVGHSGVTQSRSHDTSQWKSERQCMVCLHTRLFMRIPLVWFNFYAGFTGAHLFQGSPTALCHASRVILCWYLDHEPPSIHYFVMMITTRRFFCRPAGSSDPSGFLFGATGFLGPKPCVVK